MATTKLHTIEDLEQMEGERPYELIRGVLREVTPCSVKSNVISGRIFLRVGLYVEQHDLGYATSGEGGFILRHDPDTMVAPDVGFIRSERLPNGLPSAGFSPIPPDFAVEVMSPSDRPRDTLEKVGLYLDAGVPLVWWVKPAERIVTVYRNGQQPRDYREGDELDGDPVLPGFRLAVSDIFNVK